MKNRAKIGKEPERQWVYSDIHCHILPGLDDGARNMEAALKMLQLSYEEGIRNVVCTPHYEHGKNSYKPRELKERFLEFSAKSREQLPELKLYLGNEVLCEPGILEQLKAGEIQTMNQSRYVLVEFLPEVPFAQMYQGLKELSAARYRPILAHAERYRCLRQEMGRIDSLQELNIYLQVNTQSIAGPGSREEVHICRRMLKEGAVTFLGTDAHNLKERKPLVKKAEKWMRRHLAEAYMENIAWNYPERMLRGEYPDSSTR